MEPTISCSLLCLLFFLLDCLYAQQDYAGRNQQNCALALSSTIGYKFIGPPSCTSYLIHKPHPHYMFDHQIKLLLDALACKTRIEDDHIFRITCSRYGDFYKHNAMYIVAFGNIYYSIAKNLYQGLTACKALTDQNPTHEPWQLAPWTQQVVTLRCACPTEEQKNKGIKHLVTYPVVWKDNVSIIVRKFNVSVPLILDENKLLAKDNIYQRSTKLVPVCFQQIVLL